MAFAHGYVEPIPPMVSVWTFGWGLVNEATAGSNPASAAWESANRGIYFPIYVPSTCVAKRMWWANGATVDPGNNVEVGIYADAGGLPGAKIITTGSVAQGTASTIQFADITDTALTPDIYWLFMSCSATAATFFRVTLGSTAWDELLRMNEAAIGPGSAPATATPSESSAGNFYLFGFSTTTIT